MIVKVLKQSYLVEKFLLIEKNRKITTEERIKTK
jgi:hypothetical protein